MESLSSVMKVRPQKPDHHQELKVTSSTKKVTNSETKKNSEVSKMSGHSIFKNLNVRISLHHLFKWVWQKAFYLSSLVTGGALTLIALRTVIRLLKMRFNFFSFLPSCLPIRSVFANSSLPVVPSLRWRKRK